MRKWIDAAESRLFDVMDANANTQDIQENVIELFKGSIERRKIDRLEDALRLKERELVRELCNLAFDSYCEEAIERTFARIVIIWAAQDALEGREDTRDKKDFFLFVLIDRAAGKIVALMQRAASWLETLLAAHRKPKTKKAG